MPTINYYRIKQVDYNGDSQYLETVVVNNSKESKTILFIYNLIGQPVDIDYPGTKIIRFSDGTIKKIQ